jgi:hypothetical protein
VTSLGPGTKTPPKHILQGRRTLHKPKQKTSKPSKNNTTQRHTSQAIYPRQIPHKHTPVRLVTSTGQTGHAWAARDEELPRVNSSKTNSRSPDSLHGFRQDFGDSRNTSWALHSQVMVHQNSLNQEESKDSTKNSSNPRTLKTLKSSTLTHGFGRGIKGKRTTKGSHIHPPPNPQEQGLENTPRYPPREGSGNHHQEQTGTTQPSLEEPRRIIYTYQRGSYKV